MDCVFCDEPARWVHTLDWDRAQFRVYGKGHVWGSPATVCGRCEGLYRAGDDAALLALQSAGSRLSEIDVQEQFGNALRAFRTADTEVVAMDDWLPAGSVELVAAGFVPVEELTGDPAVARAWPAKHRRSIPETRAERLDSDDSEFWLVRSPWPTVSVEQIFHVIWQWAEARDRPRSGRWTAADEAQHEAVLAEFFRLDETTVRALAQETA